MSSSQKILRNLIIGYLTVGLWFGGAGLYFYVSKNPYAGIGYAMFIMFSVVFGSISGLIAFLLRIGSVTGPTSFVYQLIGCLNIGVGLVGVYLLFFEEMELIFLLLFALRWVWGIYINKDALTAYAK